MSSAFVVGYTGECGKALVKELIARKRFDRLTLIGRKQADSDLPSGVECKVIDFDKLDEHKTDFAGFDQGFCCLGSTRSKHGVETFLKVDRDITNRVAELAKEGGCKHYHLVSSSGAAKSRNLYLNTKFIAEEHAIAQGFDYVSIYRPGLIMCERTESRPAEHFIRTLAKPFAWACPTLFTTPVETIGQAMVSRSMLDETTEPKGAARLSIADMFAWAKKLTPLEKAEHSSS